MSASILCVGLLLGLFFPSDTRTFAQSPSTTIQQKAGQNKQKEQSRPLPIKRSPVSIGLQGGEKHSYTVKLNADQMLHLVIEQQGIDVVVTLYGPDEKKLREVDSPNGTDGEEPLSWIAETQGLYRVEVRSLEKDAQPGRYALKGVEKRQATPRDRKFVTADLAFAAGEKLRAESEEKSWREALLKYETALPLWRELEEKLREAQTLYWIGRLNYRLSEPQKALAALNQALPLFTALGEHEQEASTLNNLGLAEAEVKEHHKALNFSRQALQVCHDIHCDFEADILNNIGTEYKATGDRKKALETFQQAAPLYGQINRREDEAGMWRQIGDLQLQAGDYPAAINAYTQLLDLRRSLHDRHGEVIALLNIGKSHNAANQSQKALEFCRQALPLAKEEVDQSNTVFALYLSGLAYRKLGNHQKALESLSQAASLSSGGDQASILSIVADVHHRIGNRPKALEIYQQTLTLMQGKKWDDRSEIERRIKELEGELKAQQELQAVQQQLNARRSAADRPGEAQALERAGMLYLTLGELPQAGETFKHLATLQHALNKPEQEAEALNKLGLISLALQDKTQTLAQLSQALKIYREIGDRREEKDLVQTSYQIAGAREKATGETNGNFYRQMREAYETVGDSKAEIALTTDVIQEMWIAKQHLIALQTQNLLLQEALALKTKKVEQLPTLSSRISTLSGLADLLVEGEHWPQALESYQKLLALQREQGDQNGQAATLHKIGNVYFAQHNHRLALEFYTDALNLRRQMQDQQGEAQTLVALGMIENWQGDRQKALALYAQALPLQRELKDQSGEALTLYRIGESYFLLGEKQKALDNFNQSLTLTRTDQDRLGDAKTLEYIGLVYASLGQPQKEQEFYKYALTQAQRSLAIVRAGRKTELGKFFLQNDNAKATTALRPGVNSAQEYLLSEKKQEGTALADLGEAYYRLGLKKEALESFNQALPMLKDIGHLSSAAQVLNKLGLLYAALGDHQRALEDFKQALDLRRADGNRGREAEVLHNVGFVYESLGDKQKALENYRQALTLRRAVMDAEGEGETLDRLMHFWKALAQTKIAIFYGKQAVNAFQQLRSHIQGLDKDIQKSFLTSRADTYRQLADLLITDGRLPEAQQVLDLLKQEEFLDFVRGETAGGPNASAILNREEATLLERYHQIEDQIITISRQSADLNARPSRTPQEEQLLRKLDQDLQASNVAFEKFLNELPSEFTSVEKGEVKAALKAAELRATQELSATLRELGPKTVAIYTIVSPDKYHVILFTSETQVARAYSISAKELNRKIHQFRVVLRNPEYDPLPLAQELYKIIIGPIAKDLEAAKADTLMWELDGTLRYLPIAALHDGRRYMVEKYRNSVFTPASQSRLEKPPGESWRGLGLGVSKSAVPLPFVVDELRGIIHDTTLSEPANNGVIDGKIMLDDSFTKIAMKSALGGRGEYSVVHIASHFIFKPGNETDSYLLLGGATPDTDEDRHLTLAEIKRAPNLFRGVELLTLSACNTAVGEGTVGAGAEVENFGVLAQLKGARAVIATLWRVNDSSTMQLMKTFYRLHNESPTAPKIEALRQAQLELLRGEVKSSGRGPARRDGSTTEVLDDWEGKLPRFKTDPEKPYAHPYFWAPFILIGNWR